LVAVGIERFKRPLRLDQCVAACDGDSQVVRLERERLVAGIDVAEARASQDVARQLRFQLRLIEAFEELTLADQTAGRAQLPLQLFVARMKCGAVLQDVNCLFVASRIDEQVGETEPDLQRIRRLLQRFAGTRDRRFLRGSRTSALLRLLVCLGGSRGQQAKHGSESAHHL